MADASDPIEQLRRSLPEMLSALRCAGADTARPKAMRCPFHEDTEPSSGVYEDEAGVWRFKCQSTHCGFGGDVFDVRQRATGETVESQIVAIRRATKNEHHARRPSRRFASIDAWRAATPHVTDIYRYTNPSTGFVELLKARIEPPGERKRFLQAHVTHQGEVIESAPPAPHPIYNRTRILAAEQVVFVEGEKCVHALAGVNVVATCCSGGGRKGSASDADLTPLAGKVVILWPDHDAPDKGGNRGGHDHMREVAEQLRQLADPPSVYWLDPDKLKLGEAEDVADYLGRFPDPSAHADAVSDALDLAAPIGGASVEVGQWIEDIIAGRVSNIETPYAAVTRLARGLLPGTVMVLVGDPGAAKSMLIGWMLAWWVGHNVPVAAYMLEDDRRFHLARILAQLSENEGMNDDKWVKEHPEEARQIHRQFAEQIDRIGATITDAPDVTLDYGAILKWIRASLGRGCRVLVVDPITAVDSGQKPWETDKAFMAEVKAVLRKHGASLILVTHPRDGKNHGSLDQIAGSRAFPRFSQTVLWLKALGKSTKCRVKHFLTGIERHEEIDRKIVIAKSRNGRGQGVPLGYRLDSRTLRFEEVGIVLKDGEDE